jgi:hypothetical protein
VPRMNQIANRPEFNRVLAKLLLIADGKLGKSFYAAMAAKAGFNVLYFDGDVAMATISGMTKVQPPATKPVLSPEEASRIYVLSIGDTVESGGRDTKMVDVLNEFTKAKVFRWNDTDQRVAKRADTDKEVWEIRPGLMGPNDIWVLDSWTSYCESLMQWVGEANGVQVSEAKTHEMRPVYQGGGLKATEMLQVIRSMPCNVIVLGHPDEYTHTTLKEGVTKGKATEKDQIVDWTKMIAKTVSKPQGLVMPKYFTDVAWMEYSPAGTERRLNFKPHNDKVGGGHFDGIKSVDEYSFANLCNAIGVPKPTPQEPAWLKIIPPMTAEERAEQAASPAPATQVLDGTKPKAANGGGLASLFAKQATG